MVQKQAWSIKNYGYVGDISLCWSIWTTRNKFTTKGSFLSQPSNVLYKMSLYLQLWKVVTKRKDRDALGVATDKI
jgi:hypothetical protein